MQTIIRVAGTTGVAGSVGDNGPATLAQLLSPAAVAATSDGGFFVVDAEAHVVRKVSADDVITRVAGTEGVAGSAGNGGPAISAHLSLPGGLAVTADGGFLIADTGNNVVRKVSAGGVITRVAGTGEDGDDGDGGAATAAQVWLPIDVAVTPDGGFLIAEYVSSVVRKVSADGGVITRIAGTGTAGPDGDGGPATAAQLGTPRCVAPTPDGGFLIADTGNQVVRRVSPDGVITRVAGTADVAAGGRSDEISLLTCSIRCPRGDSNTYSWHTCTEQVFMR